MSNEIIAVVDENDFVIGKKDRLQVHKDGDLHREVCLFLFDLSGNLLLTCAADTKKWDCSVAGHISWNESCEDGIIREAKEELGLDICVNELTKVGCIRHSETRADQLNNRFITVFRVKKEISLDDLKPANGEVVDVAFLSINAVSKLQKENPFNYEKRFKFIFKWYLDKNNLI
ncbi:MAG: NUDIX hydrolase [Candidatus Woesearchaeota archaeon]